MSERLRKIAVGLVGLVVVGAIVAYVGQPEQPQQTKRGRFAGSATGPVPVLVANARVADVPVYLDGVGTARALNTVTVRPQVEGKLISVQFTEGQDVRKGDVLARIDPTTFQAQLDQAVAKKAQDEAMLANARLDLDRYTRLAATNSATKQQADTQRAMVNQLEAQVKADQAIIDNARAIVNYTTITAPISGRTGIRLVDEGNIVRGSDLSGIVMITQIKPISVFFNLPQQSLPEINKGMAEGPLPVEALQADGKSIADRGKLVVVDNLVDQTTGTVRLKAEFPNDQLQLWPGQFVNVRLLIDTRRNVVVVPTAAVQRGPNGTFVYVVGDDNSAAVRPVTVAQQDDAQAVIETGLQAAERVVTTGFVRLTDGSTVRITDSAEGAPPAAKGRPEAFRRENGGKRPDRAKRDNVGAGPDTPRGERGEKGKRSQAFSAPGTQP